MSPELLLTMAAGLLAAAAVIVLILHRILRKQCDEIARRAAQQDLPEVTRRLNDLTERIETQWVSWREQLERAAEGTAEAAGPSATQRASVSRTFLPRMSTSKAPPRAVNTSEGL